MNRTKSMTCRGPNCGPNMSNPFSGAGLNMNMNMSPFSFQQFGNNSFNQPKMQFPQRMPSFNPYSNLQGYRR